MRKPSHAPTNGDSTNIWRTLCFSLLAVCVTVFTLWAGTPSESRVRGIVAEEFAKRGDRYAEDRQMILKELERLTSAQERFNEKLDSLMESIRHRPASTP